MLCPGPSLPAQDQGLDPEVPDVAEAIAEAVAGLAADMTETDAIADGIQAETLVEEVSKTYNMSSGLLC